MNDNLAIIGVSLALLDIVMLILMIRFFIRAKKAGALYAAASGV